MDIEFGGVPVVDREPDEIDDLVDHELTLPKFHDPYKLRVPCPMCGNEWHGLPRGDCPGYVTR